MRPTVLMGMLTAGLGLLAQAPPAPPLPPRTTKGALLSPKDAADRTSAATASVRRLASSAVPAETGYDLAYFAATATDRDGLTSDYSNEAVWTNYYSNYFDAVTVAWDPGAGTNVIANYTVLQGPQSRTYTNTQAAGTNRQLTMRLTAPAPTNRVISVSTRGATNLAWAASLKGPWTRLGATNWTGTNLSGPRYFRAMKRNSQVFIRSWME